MKVWGSLKLLLLVTAIKSENHQTICPDMCICQQYQVICSNQNLTSIPNDVDKNVKELDLSNNEFREFPNKISYFQYLESLDLSYNRRLDIIKITSHMPYLNTLNLQGCQLTFLDNILFDSMPRIRILNLSQNPKLYINSYLNSSSIQHLNLSSSNVRHVDANLFSHLTNLSVLILSENKQLKKIVCNSNNLQQLDASNCNLDSVPSGLLKTVSELNIAGNSIQIIKNNSFHSLTNIKVLNMSNNAISHIYNFAFHHSEKLSSVDLSFNKLTTVAKSIFSNNKILEKVIFSHNSFNTFGCLDSKSIQSLTCASCEISDLDQDMLQCLPGLKILNLRKNYLVRLTPLEKATKLRYLDLGYNKIQNINEKTFASMTSLKTLILSGNSLTHLDAKNIPLNVVILRIDDNPWQCDCKALLSLYYRLSSQYTQSYIDLKCHSPEKYDGWYWNQACNSTWSDTQHGKLPLWSYALSFLFSVLALVLLIFIAKRIEKMKKRRAESDETTRQAQVLEERDRDVARSRILEETESDNAPDPRETQPPSYIEALSLPRLDASHPSLASLAGSLHSISSAQGSLNDISKRKRRRRRRKRSRSTSSISETVRINLSDSETQLHSRPVNESNF